MKRTTFVSLTAGLALFAGLSCAEAAVKTVTFQIVNNTTMKSDVLFRTQGFNTGSCTYNSNSLTIVCKTDAKGTLWGTGEFTGPTDPWAMGPILNFQSPASVANFWVSHNNSAGLKVRLSKTSWPTDGSVVTVTVDLLQKK